MKFRTWFVLFVLWLAVMVLAVHVGTKNEIAARHGLTVPYSEALECFIRAFVCAVCGECCSASNLQGARRIYRQYYELYGGDTRDPWSCLLLVRCRDECLESKRRRCEREPEISSHGHRHSFCHGFYLGHTRTFAEYVPIRWYF